MKFNIIFFLFFLFVISFKYADENNTPVVNKSLPNEQALPSQNTTVGYSEKPILDEEQDILLIKQKLKIDPTNPYLLFKMGWYYQKRSFDKEAEEYYLKCIENHKEYAPALINLGNITAKQKRDEDALSYFNKAIATQSNLEEAFYNLGTFQLLRGNYEKAESAFKRTIEINEKNKEALINLSNIYLYYYKQTQDKQNINQAKDMFIKTIHVDSTYAHGYYNLGIIYESENDKAKAIESFNQALRFYSKTSPYYSKALERLTRLSATIKNDKK